MTGYTPVMGRFSSVPAAHQPRRPPPAPVQEAEDFEDFYQQAKAEEGFDFDDGVTEPEFDEADEDAYQELMTRVDQRLEAANYYRAILAADFFPGDASTVAAMVQARVQAIARMELTALLGIQGPTTGLRKASADDFSDSERAVLRAIIRATEQRQTQRATEPPQPVAAPVPSPPRPQATPTPKPQIPRAAPVIAPPRPRPRPAQAPSPKTPAPRPPAPVATAQAPARPKPQRRPVPVVSDIGENGALSERITGAERTTSGRLVRRLQVGEDARRQIVQDITPQALNPARIPMPVGGHLTAVTMQQASETVAAQQKGDSVAGAATSILLR